MKLRSNFKILSIIILIALLLRLPNLNANFAGDEIDIVGPARHFSIGSDFRVFNYCNGDPNYNYTHPPVRILLYSAWASLFGFSNIAMRALSTIFGLASILIIYLLGKELYSEKIGLMAAFLAAVSRYHIYGSNIVNTDTGHFMFTTSAAVLFFIIYLKRGKNTNLAYSIIFSTISMLTKFSTVIIFIPMLVGAYFYKKKTITTTTIITIVVLSFTLLFGISQLLDKSIFEQPFRTFVEYSTGTSPITQTYIMNKIFNLAAISWQMTPFFAILLLFALYKVNKDKNFLILSSWLVLGFLIVAAPYRQDSQRFFLMMLAPAFILTAKFIEGFNFRAKYVYITAALIIALSAIISLNDLMGYYQPQYLALFYLLALIPLLYKKYTKPILLAGFVGLSIYFVFAGNVIQTGSTAVSELSENVIKNGYSYREVWTSKDVSYYTTPNNETVEHCTLDSLDKEFIKQNNITYIAFYSTVPRQTDINRVIEYCSERKLLVIHGYTVGFTCKIDIQRI